MGLEDGWCSGRLALGWMRRLRYIISRSIFIFYIHSHKIYSTCPSTRTQLCMTIFCPHPTWITDPLRHLIGLAIIAACQLPSSVVVSSLVVNFHHRYTDQKNTEGYTIEGPVGVFGSLEAEATLEIISLSSRVASTGSAGNPLSF